jgi:hypothetical protein
VKHKIEMNKRAARNDASDPIFRERIQGRARVLIRHAFQLRSWAFGPCSTQLTELSLYGCYPSAGSLASLSMRGVGIVSAIHSEISPADVVHQDEYDT